MNIEQRSPEWYAARCGSLGASQVADAIARTKTGWGASRANVMATLIAERMTGTTSESYSNAAMRWGIDTEPQARAMYELYSGWDVVEVGIFKHPAISWTHASPDGVIGDYGLVEIKAPNTATHIDTLLTQSIDGRYITQMQWQMACSGAHWCDFVSFDPRMPEELQLWVRRVERDVNRIGELEDMVATFLAELDAKLARLQMLRGME